MALSLLRKKPSSGTEKAKDDSAAVLAARFGVDRKGGKKDKAKADPFINLDAASDGDSLPAPKRRGKAGAAAKGDRAPASKPLIAAGAVAGVFLLGLAGTAVWLAVTAHDTADRLTASRQVGPKLAVLLPDGTPRFPDAPAAEAPPKAEEAPLDPVDMPVTLQPSRNDLLLERLRVGLVPKVAADGTAPWQHYARPFPQDDKRPRIAIVVTGMGQSAAATQTAIARLPGAVSFAFAPTTPQPQPLVDAAREKGHEVLLAVPMQPQGYPASDPGANTLLTSLSDEENVKRLEATLAAFTGYVGLTSRTDSGTAFLTQRDNLRAVLQQVQRRGLVYLDLWQVQGSKVAPLAKELSLPRAFSDLQIDRMPSAIGIDEQLAQLERLAQANGVAVGFAEAQNPVVIDRLALWAGTLRDRGIVLAPVTAVVNRQADR
ncbi:divergent polysaccharide deacetylase family protein [Niveispirillum sp. BGYR6]|uniref:divergent polysaccharide deacetylase family protein n=1 Tax=Niveispirillum sp. BGYR6 TaxID=2971249 RepID=UPI0022B96854|nr:divergent polysaccharide deacetylase family protein [Niveispirillum sp. BGYR6]